MARKYDASRRAEQAAKTRDAIVAAAFRLHGQGNLDLDALADAANVSVATVRKHFPTREHLFQGCTTYGMHAVPVPDIDALARIEDPADRTREAVDRIYALHEALLGQVWAAFKLADESPTLALSVAQIDALVTAAAQVVGAAWPNRRHDEAFIAFVHGMLSPLTYRALRAQAGLAPPEAAAQVAEALVRAAAPADPAGDRGPAHR